MTYAEHLFPAREPSKTSGVPRSTSLASQTSSRLSVSLVHHAPNDPPRRARTEQTSPQAPVRQTIPRCATSWGSRSWIPSAPCAQTCHPQSARNHGPSLNFVQNLKNPPPQPSKVSSSCVLLTYFPSRPQIVFPRTALRGLAARSSYPPTSPSSAALNLIMSIPGGRRRFCMEHLHTILPIAVCFQACLSSQNTFSIGNFVFSRQISRLLH